jgi:hypothetical protein
MPELLDLIVAPAKTKDTQPSALPETAGKA